MSSDYSRSELCALVWSEPLRSLARKHGISDVRLGKICRQANIPLPGLGYWAKHAARRAGVRPPLPPRALGQSDEVTVRGYRHASTWLSDEELLSMPVPPMPSFIEDLGIVTERARKLLRKVPRTGSLTHPHPLIAPLLAGDEQRRQKELTSEWTWDKPLFDTPMEKRRLRLLNRLFLAFSRCGCPPSLRGKDARELGVAVGDCRVSFTLDPPGTTRNNHAGAIIRRVKHSDKLEINVTWPQLSADLAPIPTNWTDRKDSRLEDQLTDIAVGLLIAGEWAYRSGCIRQRNWLIGRKQEVEQRLRREQEERDHIDRARQLKAERDRRNKLFAEAAAWRKASEFRNFVNAVASTQQAGGADEAQTEFMEWSTWALAEADRIDPLCQPVETLLALPAKGDANV